MADPVPRDFLDTAVLARLARLPFCPRAPVVCNVAGAHKSPHRGSSVEFAEYRKYVKGDDIRHIDWRVYARSDRFYMKEFEADTNLRCYLVVDCSRSMLFAGAGPTKLDLARRLAGTLAHMLVDQGDAVGLLCFNDRILHDIPPRRTPSHLRHIFDTLGSVKAQGKTDVVGVLHALAEKISRRAVVLVFSDFFTPIDPLMGCFKHIQFRKHDLAVFHMLDPEELSFTFDRPVRFTDMESSYGIITDPALMRERYLEQIDSYLAAIRSGCAEFNVDYQRTLVSQDYEQLLASFLLQRIRRKKGSSSGAARAG